MRHAPVFAALALAVALLALGKPAGAQVERVYPYCFVAYEAKAAATGSYQCSYLTYEQCMAAASGLSAQCERNPALLAQPQKPAPASRKSPRR